MKEKEELLHALCNSCKKRITDMNGKRQFPCNTIHVEFASDSGIIVWGNDKAATQRLIYQALLDCLKKSGCVDLPEIKLNISFGNSSASKLIELETHGFIVSFYQTVSEIKSAELVLFPGTSQERVYPLGSRRYIIGRGVQGKYRNIEYINDISFEDNGKDPNAGVGSCHARIEFDQKRNGYRLYDQESKNKTRLVRDGTTYLVDHVTGQHLQNGDEVYFGKAPARFVLKLSEKTHRC
jgi:hypothetical protein